MKRNMGIAQKVWYQQRVHEDLIVWLDALQNISCKQIKLKSFYIWTRRCSNVALQIVKLWLNLMIMSTQPQSGMKPWQQPCEAVTLITQPRTAFSEASRWRHRTGYAALLLVWLNICTTCVKCSVKELNTSRHICASATMTVIKRMMCGDSPLQWESEQPSTVSAAVLEQKDAWLVDASALKHPLRTSRWKQNQEGSSDDTALNTVKVSYKAYR